VSGIALSHHVRWFKDASGKISNGKLLMVSLVVAQDGGIRAKHEVNSRVWHQVSLELVDIDVEGSRESQRSSEGRDQLGDQSVQIGESGLFNIQSGSANIIDGLIVQQKGDISMFQQRVGA